MISRAAPSRPTPTRSKLGAWWIERGIPGSSLISMARARRLDGQYGTGAVLSDVAGFAFVTRGKDYNVLDHPLVQARLHLPKDSAPAAPGKPAGAQPLRLSTGAGGTGGRALSRGGGHPSCQ